MRIGNALIIGMIALIALGFLGNKSIQDDRTISDLNQQISILEQQVHENQQEIERLKVKLNQSTQESTGLVEQLSGCKTKLAQQERDLLRLTAELEQLKNNPGPAVPSQGVPLHTPSEGRSSSSPAGSLAGAIAAIIQLADLNPLFFAGLLMFAFLVFVGILLILRWYLKVYRR